MEFRLDKRDHATSVAIVGSIDALTADEVSDYLHGRVDAGDTCLVADLSEVDYISSVGLRVFLRVVKTVRRQQGDFRLAGARPPVKRMLDMSGFTSILKFFDDANAALASFE